VLNRGIHDGSEGLCGWMMVGFPFSQPIEHRIRSPKSAKNTSFLSRSWRFCWIYERSAKSRCEFRSVLCSANLHELHFIVPHWVVQHIFDIKVAYMLYIRYPLPHELTEAKRNFTPLFVIATFIPTNIWFKKFLLFSNIGKRQSLLRR